MSASQLCLRRCSSLVVAAAAAANHCRVLLCCRTPPCSKDDFNGFLWNVVMLAMGGLALGQAVQSSGLLLSISSVSHH